MKRRDFLKKTTLSSGCLLLPAFLQPVNAQPAENVTGKKLLLIHLNGGNDGLNTMVPFSSEVYYRKRPKLSIPANKVLRLDDQYGLNPVLLPVWSMYQKGHLAILNNVATPQPFTSHYAAGNHWEEGFRSLLFNPVTTTPIPSFETDAEDFECTLLQVAGLLELPSYSPVIKVALDGFDTHNFQRAKHDYLMGTYSKGVEKLVHRLGVKGELDNTLVITYSEFGRSLTENTRHGTEHGCANTVFIMGSRLKKPGVHAEGNLPLTAHQQPFFGSETLFNTLRKQWFNNLSFASVPKGNCRHFCKHLFTF